MGEPQPVDLTNCDVEPIHIPGSIQPHGALLAFDAGLTQVLRHSANAAAMLGLAGEVNGAAAETLLGGTLTHDLRNALTATGEATRPALLFAQPMPAGGRFDIALHRYLGNVIVEFEPAAPGGDQPLQITRTMVDRIGRIDSQDALMQTAVRLVRGILGYDRVMIYQFERDGAGKVVAETRRPDLESFLGQYFPGSDIPRQARALYLQNTIRIISSSAYDPVRLVPQFDLAGAPLDLSYAHLRSVSPIHLEYLRNMGVGASMSISIIIDGQLWGLIACHHYSPRTLPMAIRVAAEMFGEFFSLHLGALRQQRMLNVATEARAYLDRVLKLASQRNVEEVLVENLKDFGRLVQNDGYALYLNGRWSAYGATPSATDAPALALFVGSVANGRVWSTHSLATDFPAADAYYQIASGVLAIPLSHTPRDYLFFFRKELVQTLDWAGNPEKSYETGPLGDRLTPRKSFAIWKQTVHRQAQPWTDGDREIAEAARASLVEVVLRHAEMLEEERAKADVRQRMLNEELNHRVKNILSIIKSLVSQPTAEGRSLDDYVASLQGRIQALSFAHDQVVRGQGGGVLMDLVNAELTPYRTSLNAISVRDEGVWVDARAYSVMALVLHELATNAAKYGALSVPRGHLDIAARIEADGTCELSWRESGGPAVAPPSRQGFGSALLQRSVPFDLGGESTVSYEPTGLVATFRLPARHVRRLRGRIDDAAADGNLAIPTGKVELPRDLRIMLLEDQMLIAMDVEAMLAERGFTNLLTVNSAADAKRLVTASAPAIAILDVNLGEGTSIPVARDLRERDIPFVFATGYGEGGMIPAEFDDAPVVRKPYDFDTLVAALVRARAR
jgi:light-regulated signal transduction histidine kinase (bacteriophytochrome)/CheY-like chemotaxis protein